MNNLPAPEQQDEMQGSTLLFQSQMKVISDDFKAVKMDRGTVLSQMNLNNDVPKRRGRHIKFWVLNHTQNLILFINNGVFLLF